MLFKRFFYRALKIVYLDLKNNPAFLNLINEITPIVSLLIEHLTEESNGHITAAAIKTKLRRILDLNIHQSTVQRVRHKYLGIRLNYFLAIIKNVLIRGCF